MDSAAFQAPAEVQAKLAWFEGKKFEDLFGDQAVAKEALNQLGIAQPPPPLSVVAIICYGLLGVAVLSLIFTMFVPRDSGRCYIIKMEIPSSANGSVRLDPAKGQVCPDRTVAPDAFGRLKSYVSPDLPQVFSNFSVLIAIFFAFHQWRMQRSHSTFSESFARKVTSNKTIIDNEEFLAPLVSAALDDGGKINGKKEIVPDIFVYMEMDNLEYVYEKYRDHEISPKSTLRQCFILVSRCGNPEFRRKAIEYSSKGFYRPEFSAAVRSIAHFSDSPSSKEIRRGRMSDL
jgi:hypothetical protein